jgi:hypothetical protein
MTRFIGEMGYGERRTETESGERKQKTERGEMRGEGGGRRRQEWRTEGGGWRTENRISNFDG